ncbi:hypothetical protein ACIBM4_26085 [Streptomyces sp. NPDC050256]|uniref:hypothetical protein n=1 Tax=Streptomyces sp. NPDC050256 TaxID=3365607 RepID=UPI0037900873
MTEQQTPEPLAGPVLELAKLRAGLAAGLTVEQSARLQGSDEAALTADATSFASELSAANPAPQGPRSGGPRGDDVSGGAGTIAAGVAAYRARNGLDENGQRPERRPLPTSTRNPYTEPTYTTEHQR